MSFGRNAPCASSRCTDQPFEFYRLALRPRTKSRRRLPRRSLRIETLEARQLLFGTSIHADLTAAAVEELDAAVLQAINARHANQDLSTAQFEQAYHFDGSHFREAGLQINEWYREAIAAANPVNFLSTSVRAAASADVAAAFGNVLHAVQDFYAHSNWAELEAANLIDQGSLLDFGGSWFDNLTPYSMHGRAMLVQGEDESPLGPGSTLKRDGKLIYVHPPVGDPIPGVITGTVNVLLYGGDDTPDSIALSHGGLAGEGPLETPDANGNPRPPLAKDEPGDSLHNAARSLAEAQTRHELYRLLNLVDRQYGSNEHLIATWVKPNETVGFREFLAAKRDADENSLDRFSQAASTGIIGDVTIVTHGFQLSNRDGDSLLPLADAIHQRQGGWLIDVDVVEEGGVEMTQVACIAPDGNCGERPGRRCVVIRLGRGVERVFSGLGRSRRRRAFRKARRNGPIEAATEFSRRSESQSALHRP